MALIVVILAVAALILAALAFHPPFAQLHKVSTILLAVSLLLLYGPKVS